MGSREKEGGRENSRKKSWFIKNKLIKGGREYCRM